MVNTIQRLAICVTLTVLGFAQQPQPAQQKAIRPVTTETIQKEKAAAQGYAQLAAQLSAPAAGPASPIATNTDVFGKKQTKGKTAREDEVSAVRVVPLPANVQPALLISRSVLNADPHATQSTDGRVVYEFGHGTFPLVCAPLHITEIDFEPGELIDPKSIDIGVGDHLISWALHSAGMGEGMFSYLAVKALDSNIDTTMTVGTSKRVYYFHLMVAEQGYVARVTFAYPDEVIAKQKAASELAKAREEEASKLARLAPPHDIKNWNYAVEFTGKDARLFAPKSVGDDTVRTYIELQPKFKKLGSPTLQIVGAAGPIPANTHWQGATTLVVDAIFDKGCLLYGVGKKQQKACIVNKDGKNGAI